MTPKAALFFAAGLGTRMGALTAARPKSLIDVGGRALIDHALTLATDAGIARRVVNIHYLGAMLRAYLAGQEVAFSDETDFLLETGGGLKKALPLLGQGPVYTMNTDAVWAGPNPFAELTTIWDPARMDGLLLLVPRANAVGHSGKGDFIVDADGRLTPGTGPIYSGLQIIRPDGLSEISESRFSMWRLWDRMLAQGRLYGHLYSGQWCDVGQPESIALAEAMLKATP
jgi:MurNAc alpha-1-phosphate uridylyltransferase